MTIHYYRPDQSTMYGTVSAEFEPAITIRSGDTVHYSMFDAGWGTPSAEGRRTKPYERRPEIDLGHALCGPLYIPEAKKGMTLEVRIDELVPGPYGFTAAGQYPNWQNRMLGLTEYEEIILGWELDAVTRVGRTTIKDRTFAVGLQPFLGFLGMPPEEKGIHTTWPPRFSGGNIDCKELTEGSRLYLPIPVDGAYFFAGDGHAAQGDGEISCQAIECPMESARLTFRVHEDMPLTLPFADTANGWVTFGFHEDLNEATVQAMDGMLNLMGKLYGLNRVEAIALGSAVVDLRITQVVNGVKGVHAVLPRHSLR
ncbi:acetamidase/formamidase family protein [Paenibacillus kobensis]|uniref:acetamidase/formamidase family protein n=1 Tax=Paenibacillus kobensis TaxID=59841 RepID=UPI000FDA6E02|nr:acetamidase/formamidase family protein [Paenibacillus kobensis]